MNTHGVHYWGPELDTMIAILNDGDHAGVVITGGPGAGKTTLVRAALGQLCHAASLTLQCSAALANIPYGALSPFLTDLEEIQGPVDVLRALQHRLAPASGATPSGTASPNQPQRPVIVVEDCQFLDAASGFVLAQLGQNREAVLLATSTGAPGRESGLNALVDTGLLATVVVQPFTMTQARKTCETVLGGVPTHGALRTVLGMTGGNPRLISAFVASAVEQGIFVQDPDAPTLPGSSEPWVLLRPSPSVDDRLIDTVEAMLAELTVEEQLAVTILALAGRMPRWLLRAVAGDHGRDLTEIHVTRDADDGFVELSSVLFAEVLRASVPPGRSAVLLGQWRSAGGAALQPPPGRSVLWAVECGHPVTEDDIVTAGYEFLATKDWPAAWALISQAGEPETPRTVLLRAEVMLAGGRTWAGRAELQDLADTVTDEALLTEVLCVLAMDLVRYGELASSWEALRQVRSEYLERAWMQGREALLTEGPLVAWLDQVGRVDTDAERPRLMELSAQLLSDSQTLPAVRILAHLLRVQLLGAEGYLVDAVGEATHTYAESSSTPRMTALMGVHAMTQLVMSHILAGNHEAVEQLLDEQRNGVVRRWHARSGSVLALQGLVDFYRGRLRQGIGALRDAAVDLGHADPAQLMPLVEALHALGTTLYVDTPGTDDNSTVESIQAGGRRGPTGRWLLSMAVASLADDLGQVGTPDQGSLWRNIIDDPALDQYPVILREILLIAVMSRAPDDDAHELTSRLYRSCAALDGPRSSVMRRVFAPGVVADPVQLADAAEHAKSAGDLLLAADAWARVVMLHHRAGDLRRRGEALRRLQDTVHALGGSPHPYVREALRLGALTDREREIVQLALEGRGNAEIAGVLVVSPRTVEGHLYRVFTKLGITDRAELRGLRF